MHAFLERKRIRWSKDNNLILLKLKSNTINTTNNICSICSTSNISVPPPLLAWSDPYPHYPTDSNVVGVVSPRTLATPQYSAIERGRLSRLLLRLAPLDSPARQRAFSFTTLYRIVVRSTSGPVDPVRVVDNLTAYFLRGQIHPSPGFHI